MAGEVKNPLDTTSDDPRCDKCGAPITTGLMAVFCPLAKECEFWVEDAADFLNALREGQLP